MPSYDTCDLETCWTILSDHGDGEPNNNTISRSGPSTGTVLTNIFTADKVYYTTGMPHEYLDLYGEPVVIDFKSQILPDCSVIEIYGEHAKETECLRHFRDNVLRKTPEGQELIQLYYQRSPVMVKAMDEDTLFKAEIKAMIDEILPLIR